jgi:hypothetical protein
VGSVAANDRTSVIPGGGKHGRRGNLIHTARNEREVRVWMDGWILVRRHGGAAKALSGFGREHPNW